MQCTESTLTQNGIQPLDELTPPNFADHRNTHDMNPTTTDFAALV